MFIVVNLGSTTKFVSMFLTLGNHLYDNIQDYDFSDKSLSMQPLKKENVTTSSQFDIERSFLFTSVFVDYDMNHSISAGVIH